MTRSATISVFVALGVFAACETPVVDYVPPTTDATGIGATDVDVVSTPPPFVPECDPAAESSGCAEGLFCETTARICVECVATVQRCDDSGNREQCERPESEGEGDLVGGFFGPHPCEPLNVCVPDGVGSVSCEFEICTPGLRRCASPAASETCNAYGTAYEPEMCGDGWACLAGECQPIRHNVLLIFDTSTSMFDFSDGVGRPDDTQYVFPECSNDALPVTLFDLAKTIFADNIVDAVGEFSHFALQRFPQYVHAGRYPTCLTGYYVNSVDDVMTGDDDSFDTTLGSWFTDNRDEVLVVPFGTRLDVDNTSALLSWLDFDEGLQSTSQACTAHEQCPSLGCLLDPATGTNRCHVHDQPELRMGGQTPLGKSLFYAGEYFRRSVLIDGRTCSSDADCPSAGYVCADGVCRDPYVGCRDNIIVLFTDGEENRYEEKDEFFSPFAQAKRLAFGLHCEEDADCRGGATCIHSFDVGYCQPPGDSISDAPFLPDAGSDALSRPDGTPISIRTTVVNLRSTTSPVSLPNATIARWGGGELVEVYSDDPDDMRAQLYEIMTPAFKCAPESF